jgi:hypothetical protein
MCITVHPSRLPSALTCPCPRALPRAATLSTPIPNHSVGRPVRAALLYRARALSHSSLERRLGTAAIEHPLHNVPRTTPSPHSALSHLRVCSPTVCFHRPPRRPLRSDLWLLSSSPTPKDPDPPAEDHQNGVVMILIAHRPTPAWPFPCAMVRRPRSEQSHTKFGRGL